MLQLFKAMSVISETKFGLLKLRLRLVFFQSQFQDQVRDCNFLSLGFETDSETGFFLVSISRPSPRLKLSKSQPRDRVRDHRIGQDQDWDLESRYTLVQDPLLIIKMNNIVPKNSAPQAQTLHIYMDRFIATINDLKVQKSYFMHIFLWLEISTHMNTKEINPC